MNTSANTLWAVFWIGLFSAVVVIAFIIAYDGKLADEKRHARDLANIEKNHTRDLARIEQGQCEVRGNGGSAWYPCATAGDKR